MSVNDKIPQDKNTPFTLDTVRAQLNNIITDNAYESLNHPAWNVSTAAVAPPVCARASTASQVKTTATTQLWVGGVVKSLTGTDNLWTLTGGNLAIGSVRRYQLLWDGTTATTVVSVAASNDQVIANFASATVALAACRWPNTPVGAVIVGVLSIANTTNAFIPGTTLLSAAGVTDTYIDGPDGNCFSASIVTP